MLPVKPISAPQPRPHRAAVVRGRRAGGEGRGRGLLIWGVLVCVPLVVFSQTRRFEFLTWDDNGHISSNPYLVPLSISGLWHLWREPYFGLYAPLTYTFFAAEAWLSERPAAGGVGLDAGLFHLGSVGLHVANVLLVYMILRRLVPHRGAACLGALVFAVHPVQVESVAWVSETRGLLAGFFCLVALWQYILFAQSPSAPAGATTGDSPGRRSYGHYAAATVAFGLALLAKPSAVALPLLALAIDAIFLAPRDEGRAGWRRLAGCGLAIAPWLVLVAGVLVITQRQQSAEAIRYVAPPMSRPRIAGDAVAFYLYKLALPVTLGPDYGRSARQVLADRSTYVTALMPLVAALGLVWVKDRRVWLTGVGLFIAGIAPVLGLVPFGYQDTSTVADRYLYLAMLGPCLLLCCFLARHWSTTTAATAATAVALLAGMSFVQTGYWHDDERLFTHGLEVNPTSPVAHTKLGLAAQRRHDYDAALRHFEAARQADPTYAPVYNNLAAVLSKQGRPAAAIEQLEKAVALDPTSFLIRHNLADMYLAQARVDDALNGYAEAVRLNPDFMPSRFKYGFLLAKRGDLTAALPQIEAVLAREPANAEAHYCAGHIFARQGQLPAAEAHYAEAARLKPQEPRFQQALEALRRQRGRS